MYATTLQLIKAVPLPGLTAAVGPVASDISITNFQISDLTLDANLARQPKGSGGTNTSIKTDGLGLLFSNNITVRRVRVINWGTHTSSHEGFPIYIESPNSNVVGNNVIEDCIVEQPDWGNAREVTMLNVHSHPLSLGVLNTMRNNYLNAEYTRGTPPAAVAVSAIAYASGVATVQTTWPHRLQAGDEVIIAGSSVTQYNGRKLVASADDYCTFTFAESGLPSPPVNAGITMQRYVDEAMPVTGFSYSGGVVTITTARPHFRKALEYIRISGVKVSGSLNNYFNGSFSISSVTSTTIQYTPNPTSPLPPDSATGIWLDRWPSQHVIIANGGLSWQPYMSDGLARVATAMPHFKAPGDYVLISGVGGDPRWNGYFPVINAVDSRQLDYLMPGSTAPAAVTYDTAQIPQAFQAMTATLGYGGRAFGNRVCDLSIGGPYHDLGPTKTQPDKDLTVWNNYYYFTYSGPFSNVADQEPTNDNRQLWNTARDNIVDLQPFAVGTWNQSPPGGILYWGPYPIGNTYFPSFQTTIIRDNIIRFADAQASPGGGSGYTQWGIDVRSAMDLVVEDNLILFPQTLAPLTYSNVQNPHLSNNIGINGTPI
jgi:hypothetical protein